GSNVALRQRLLERGVRHAERREDVVLHVCSVGFAGDALHDVSNDRDAVVGIRERLTRRSEPMRLIADQERANVERQLAGLVRAEVVQFLLEARAVRSEVAKSNGRVADAAWPGIDLEVEILLDVGVEVELALLDEL